MDPTGGRDRTVSSWVWTTFVEYAVQRFRRGQTIAAPELSRLGDAYVAHAREVHDWPYPEQAIRNYAEATQRLTGGSERPPQSRTSRSILSLTTESTTLPSALTTPSASSRTTVWIRTK